MAKTKDLPTSLEDVNREIAELLEPQRRLAELRLAQDRLQKASELEALRAEMREIEEEMRLAVALRDHKHDLLDEVIQALDGPYGDFFEAARAVAKLRERFQEVARGISEGQGQKASTWVSSVDYDKDAWRSSARNGPSHRALAQHVAERFKALFPATLPQAPRPLPQGYTDGPFQVMGSRCGGSQ